MTTLSEVYQSLAVALTGDPLLLLASAVATFDPFWSEREDDLDGDGDPLTIALHITRGAFPEIYAHAVDRLWAGASAQELDALLCSAITDRGIPLDSLELIGWGIPLESFGVTLDEPEFYSTHPDIVALLTLFGIVPPDDEEAFSVDVPDSAFAIGRALHADLQAQTDPTARGLAPLFGWLFSCTGNSLVDLSHEELSEIEPLSWTPDDIEFARVMIEEAAGIMHDVQAGLETINASASLMTALEQNITLVSRHLNRKGRRNEHAPRLEWPRADGGADGEAVAGPLVLQLRHHAA